MNLNKYIIVPCVQLNNDKKELIPIWDKRLEFIKDEYYGNHLKFNGKCFDNSHYQPIECMMNLETKELSEGIILDIKEEKGLRKAGDEVYYVPSLSHKKLKKSKIKEIVFHKIGRQKIENGKKLEEYEKKLIQNFNPEKLYCIRYFEKEYLLENGEKTIDLYIYNFEE